MPTAIRLSTGGWRSPEVRLALTPRARLRGMRAVTPGTGILLRTSWVHGRGLPGPIGLVRIDRDGVATATAVLPAGGHRRFPGRGWVLELPAGTPLPPVGATLSAGPIFAGCPAA